MEKGSSEEIDYNRALQHGLYVFPVLLLFVGLCIDSPRVLLEGLRAIMLSPSVLLHDYLEVGGLGATLVNAGLCGIICCVLLVLLRVELNGPFVAAVYTVVGFAFFGKNVLNIWPIFFGTALFAKVQGVPLRNYALVALFGTTLAPLVSAIAFGSHLTGVSAIAVGVLMGVVAGFVLPPLASHMLRFHDGYNIYNIGFTGGIIGSFLTAWLRSFDFTIGPTSFLSPAYDRILRVLLMAFFSFLMLFGYVIDRCGKRVLAEKMRLIHASSGRLISDFMRIGDFPSMVFNMGFMGLIASFFVIVLGGQFNGPVIGGILTVTGFAAFGKHVKNCVPILAGVYLASLLKIWDGGSTPVIIAGLFGTTLAPIAGQFGVFAGVLAGFCHLSIVMNVGVLHGGVNLYNNGFAGGFVASFLVPIINALKRESKA
ncbi:MAG: DUF1576 domain-containing protein [Kiritimatiellia bacterium]